MYKLAKRPRPLPHQIANVRDLRSSRRLELTLLKPVNDGFGRLAQVWIVSAPMHSRLIVEIYQSCFAEDESFWHDRDECMYDFTPDEEQAHREAWAYQTLEPLQGIHIPRSYGLFEVIFCPVNLLCKQLRYLLKLTLPSGDKTFTHVMEEISGRSLLSKDG